MILVKAKRKGEFLVGFQYKGHAEFAEAGQDIVCAAVTSQLMMAYNGLDKVLAIPMTLDMDDHGGYFEFDLKTNQPELIERAQVLMETLRLGILGIEQQYEDYITLTEEEV